MTSYDNYVKDETFLAFYNDYQKRYAGEIAERDKVMQAVGKATGKVTAEVLEPVAPVAPDCTMSPPGNL